MFKQLDHIAIVVRNTEEALRFYQGVLGLRLLFSQELTDQPVRLSHLDMGGVQLQLVEPLRTEHPLSLWLDEHGEGFHHLCFLVDSVSHAIKDLPEIGIHSQDKQPRSGPNGRAAAFLETTETRGLLIEITSERTD